MVKMAIDHEIDAIICAMTVTESRDLFHFLTLKKSDLNKFQRKTFSCTL